MSDKPCRYSNGDGQPEDLLRRGALPSGLYGRVFQEEQTPTGRFEVATGPHGLGGLETGGVEISERDLADGYWPGHEAWEVEGLPGEIGPHFAEQNQRRFYTYWAQLMAQPDRSSACPDRDRCRDAAAVNGGPGSGMWPA